MNISIEIKAPELATAILSLAEALKGTSLPVPQQPLIPAAPVQPEPTQPVYQAPTQPVYQAPPVQQIPEQPTNVVPITPVQQPVQQQPPVQQQAPVAPPQAVPTSTATYTMDQLAVAATQLVDAGRRDDLLQLLASFGAQALMQLPKEQYGAFATKLREMGAKI